MPIPITAIGTVGLCDRERTFETRFGEGGELAPDGREVGPTEEVARRDPQELPALPAAERARIGDAVRREQGAVLVGVTRPREGLGVFEGLDERGVVDECGRERARSARDRDECVAHVGLVADHLDQLGVSFDDARQHHPGDGWVGRPLQRRRHPGRGEHGDGIEHAAVSRAQPALDDRPDRRQRSRILGE